jgi:mono/diheme cytochrome c family protein
MKSVGVLIWASVFVVCSAACNRDRGDVREWKASDHDHTAEPNAAQAPSQPSPAASAAAANGVNEVTIVAWKQNCVTCHGIVGAGDGPQGPAVRARNLGDPAWQAQTSDEDIATAIRSGKGAMPAFPLPDSTITGLVHLVRLLNTAAPSAEGPSEAASAAPSASPPKPQ